LANEVKKKGKAAAVDILVKIIRDEIEYARMTTLLKSELDWLSRETNAKRKGRAEGILEVARKMKNAGRPLSEIEEFTGLPHRIISHLTGVTVPPFKNKLP